MSRTSNRLRVAADESLPPLLRRQAWLSASLFPAESEEAWEQVGVSVLKQGEQP